MFEVNRKKNWKTLCIFTVLLVPFIVTGCGNKNNKKNNNVLKENIKKIHSKKHMK